MSNRNIFRKILDAVTDTSLSRAERTYCMLIFTALIAFALAIAITIIFNFSVVNVAIRIGIWLTFFFLAYFSVKMHKTKPAIYITAVLLIFVLLSYNYFSSGGFMGGTVAWSIFSLVCVAYIIDTRMKYFFFASGIILFVVCSSIEYLNPEIFDRFDKGKLFIKGIFSSIVVAALTFATVLFQNKMMRADSELAIRQRKEIEEMSKAQSRFFSSMSHEIRTPLNTIVGLNEMIQRECVSEDVAQDAARVESASKMLLSLINDILDISKMEAGKMEITPAPYETGSLLSELVDMVWFSAKEKGLEFHLSVDGNIPARLEGDDSRIKQILVNILNNAVKYTQKGSITLTVHCVPSSKGGGMVEMVFTVADTGMGIKQENIPHLFTVFKRVELEKTRNIEGTGLGLSIVKQLVDLMGGSVEVNSVYTKGSAFAVRLPQKALGDELLDGAAIKVRHSIGIDRGRTVSFTAPDARILVVDDNESNLLVAKKLLSATKAKVETASSGEECLKKTQQARYDVIFMDHLMPHMDGIECLRKIRRQADGLNAQTPVVALTANAGREAHALYMREGFDGILIKPINGARLEAEVLRHLPPELANSSYLNKINESYETAAIFDKHRLPLIIATDASADIPRELIQQYNIALLPVEIETDGGNFVDGMEIDQDGILRYIESGGKKKEVVDQTLQSYTAAFPRWLSRAQRVIYLSSSAKVITSYPEACEAARSFASISVFDSEQFSAGLGLMALKAAELANQGAEPDKIMLELEALRERVQMTFVVNDTSYLLESGKGSRFICRACTALLLHPILGIRKGQVKAERVEFGPHDSCWKSYLKWALRKPSTIDKKIALLTHAGISERRLAEIGDEIKRLAGFENIYFQKMSAAVSASFGPGSFGIAFVRTSSGGGVLIANR